MTLAHRQQSGARKRELGEKPILPLLVKLSTPAIIGMTVNSLYNLVDAIFVGQGAGAEALAALAISFPLQMVILALGIMLGVGSASIFSRAMGGGDDERARQAAGSAIFIVVILGVLIAVAGLVFLEPLLLLFGATSTVLPHAKEYMSIIFLGSPFYIFTVAINHLVRAEGSARYSMYAMFISTGLNLALDPVFIFGLDMGIRGAAVATVISLGLSTLFIARYFWSGRSVLELKYSHIRFRFPLLREIFAIGSSTLVRNLGGSIMAVVLFNAINYYGDDIHLAIVGAANRLGVFIYLPMIGLVQGLQPIVGFNYGAKNFGRVRKALRLAIGAATLYAVATFSLVMMFSGPLMSMFGTEQALSAIGGNVLRIMSFMLPLLGIHIIGASYFQAIGKAGVALLLNSAQRLLFLVPGILLLPLLIGLEGIWFAFPVADVLTVALTFTWLIFELRELTRSREEREKHQV